MTLLPYGTLQCVKCGLSPRIEAEAPLCRYHDDLEANIESLRWTCRRCGYGWHTAIWTPEAEQPNLPASDREMAAMSMIRTIAQECHLASQALLKAAEKFKVQPGGAPAANEAYVAHKRAAEAAGRVLR